MQYGDPRHNCPWLTANRLGYLVTGMSHWGANRRLAISTRPFEELEGGPDETSRYPVLGSHGYRRLRGDGARFLQQQQHYQQQQRWRRHQGPHHYRYIALADR